MCYILSQIGFRLRLKNKDFEDINTLETKGKAERQCEESYTYCLLTPQSITLLEKLAVTQLVKKFPTLEP
jgi:hypothetical protein